MSRPDPLTQRTARELREINPDPEDWWEGPHGHRHRLPAFDAWGAVALAIGLSALLFALAVAGWALWRLIVSLLP